jgi:hypothetical protein
VERERKIFELTHQVYLLEGEIAKLHEQGTKTLYVRRLPVKRVK